MHSVSNTMSQIADTENIKLAFIRAAKGKTNRPDVRRILDDLDFHVKKLQEMLISETFQPAKHEQITINDGILLKKRNIIKPFYKYEQVVHHALIQVLAPQNDMIERFGYTKCLNRGFYEYSCGSIPGRGPDYGARYIHNAFRNDPANTKYFLQMDIHHFFDTIPHRHLKEKLAERIKDEATLRLLYRIIDNYQSEEMKDEPRGLPIGFYTSPWLANFYLTPLDHCIKQNILEDVKIHKTERFVNKMNRKGIRKYKVPKYSAGIPYYVRYVDDMVLLSGNKKELYLVQERVELKLKEIGLSLKPNWKIRRLEYTDKDGRIRGSRLDYLGRVFTRDCIFLRKTILIRSTRKARRIGKKDTITWHDASSMLSRTGYFKHTDTYGVYQERIKPYVNKKLLRQIMSRHTKKENVNVNQVC